MVDRLSPLLVAFAVFLNLVSIRSYAQQNETLSSSTDYIVYSVFQGLNLENDPKAKPPKDYYVNMGQAQGVKPGTLLEVRRRLPTYDLQSSQLYRDVFVPVALVRVIHTEPVASIARVEKMLSSDKYPVVSPRAIMVGDYVRFASEKLRASELRVAVQKKKGPSNGGKRGLRGKTSLQCPVCPGSTVATSPGVNNQAGSDVSPGSNKDQIAPVDSGTSATSTNPANAAAAQPVAASNAVGTAAASAPTAPNASATTNAQPTSAANASVTTPATAAASAAGTTGAALSTPGANSSTTPAAGQGTAVASAALGGAASAPVGRIEDAPAIPVNPSRERTN